MLFITKYYEGVNSFGGMVRVKDIERLVKVASFLTISFESPFVKKKRKNSHGNYVYTVGFLRFISIFLLMNKAGALYFHTVGNFIKVFPFLPFLNKKEWYIDLHGAQPEEFLYLKRKFTCFVFRFFEAQAFKFCDVYIHVSKNMEAHFKKLYPNADGSHFYAPILSPNIDVGIELNLVDEATAARSRLGISSDTPVVLYSGGIQSWQKVDDIVDYAQRALTKNLLVIILSGQAEFFLERLKHLLPNENLIIKSVLPEDLADYYLAANYGLMFRDENVLNVVSSPTKMSEYLYYGMQPVLSSLNVGDFVSLGIEYVNIKQELSNIKVPKPSLKNHNLMCGLIKASDFLLLQERMNEQC